MATTLRRSGRVLRLVAALAILLAGLTIAPGGAPPAWAGAPGVPDPAASAMSARLSVGGSANCAIDDAGGLWCWGSNLSGAAGQPASATVVASPARVELPGGAAAIDVSVGSSSACAVLDSGQVSCWGDASYGHLGNGATSGISWTPQAPITLPGPGKARRVSVGGDHACALLTDGSVSCWGADGAGQIGNGTFAAWLATPSAPLTFPGSAKATAVSAGSGHSCALLDTGGIACWGANWGGQIGDGATSDVNAPKLVTLPAPGLASAVSAGGSSTCAVLTSAKVTCWGSNYIGQLGNGTTNPTATVAASSSTPLTMPGGADVVAVEANDATCALLVGGTVACWGDNTLGQLALGSLQSPVASPTVVASLGSGVAAVDVSYNGGCALLATGTVTCWGDDGFGGLGDGPVTAESAAVPVAPVTIAPSSSGIVELGAGESTTCALDAQGQVRCWGKDMYGQLGNGLPHTSTDSPGAPLSLPGVGTAKAIAIGGYHGCALLTDGAVACWGYNSMGEVGIGPSPAVVDVPTLVTLPAPGRAVAIAAGMWHTCALLVGGAITCWGQDTFGQLGNGPATATPVATPPAPITLPGPGRAIAVSAGGLNSCAVLSTGQVTCWGDATHHQIGDGSSSTAAVTAPVSILATGARALQVSVGASSACVVKSNASVSCWGSDTTGQQGNAGATGDVLSPGAALTLPGTGSARRLGLGWEHDCVVLSDGKVDCWGSDANGEVGDGTATATVTSPTAITLPAPATQVVGGYGFTCALLATGQVSCWGTDLDGQLGNGAPTSDVHAPGVPFSLGGGSGAVAVAAGWAHTCALSADGAVRCWGSDGNGQLGDAVAGPNRNAPTDAVNLPGPAIAIDAAEATTCALLADGHIACWGANGHGETGVGAVSTIAPVAVITLPGGGRARSLSVGAAHVCALMVEGGVTCWGNNSSGELGNGTTVRALAPIPTIATGSNVVGIGAGSNSTCATLENRTVTCWGWRYLGQLGDGSLADAQVTSPPAAITLPGGTTAAAAPRSSHSAWHSCQLLVTGAIACWGNNGSGQLGIGPAFTAATPTSVANLGLPGAIDMAAGRVNGCALIADGAVRCWGYEAFGDIGTGVLASAQLNQPEAAVGLPSTRALTAGGLHMCAIGGAGDVRCWGRATNGQLGDGRPGSTLAAGAGFLLGGRTVLARPAPPVVTSVTTGLTTLTVGFSTPTTATAVKATLGPEGTATTLPMGATSVTFDGLTPGSDHTITLVASSAFGVSDPTVQAARTFDASVFRTVLPARLADTRPDGTTVDGQVQAGGIVPAGGTLVLPVGGRGDVPADATAVALNVTVTRAAGPGFVTVFPCGTDRPNAANLTYVTGDTIPNAVLAGVGTGGTVCLFTYAAVHLVVDVDGFVLDTGHGPDAYTAQVPARLADTRPDGVTIDGVAQAIGAVAAGTSLELQVAGRAGIPVDAQAAALNVTVTGAAGPGFVTAYPCGATRPTAANLNYTTGQTVPNLVVAPIGVDGKVCLFTYATVHLVVDVDGWFGQGAALVPVQPARLADTRPGQPTADGAFAGIGAVPAAGTLELQVAGRGGVPAGARTAVLNVTVTEPGAPGFVTAYPCGQPRPNAANLTYVAGQTVPNAVVVDIGVDGKVCLYTMSATHLVVDVDAYVAS